MFNISNVKDILEKQVLAFYGEQATLPTRLGAHVSEVKSGSDAESPSLSTLPGITCAQGISWAAR
jgi:hypothetical protein